jgi:hypothetical protein
VGPRGDLNTGEVKKRNYPCRDSSLGRPSRIPSLFPLSHPDSCYNTYMYCFSVLTSPPPHKFEGGVDGCLCSTSVLYTITDL